MPNVVILAGPNGAGKTAAAPTLLRDELRVSEFVNADVIARGLSGFSAASPRWRRGASCSGGWRSSRVRGKTSRSKPPFLATPSFSTLDQWRSVGYAILIVYLWLNSPETAIDRVHARATQGGHSVPDEVIRRRYEHGLLNPENLGRAMRIVHARVIRRHL